MKARELDPVKKYVKDKLLQNELENLQLKKQIVLQNRKYKSAKVPARSPTKEKEMDQATSELFEIVDVMHGDESMSVKPWLGAIREPKNHPPINPKIPDQEYAIEFVYGYKSEDVRQNLFYNAKRRPVYMTAALGIILDPGRERKQIIFGGGETK
jgi:hypothetical protein